MTTLITSSAPPTNNSVVEEKVTLPDIVYAFIWHTALNERNLNFPSMADPIGIRQWAYFLQEVGRQVECPSVVALKHLFEREQAYLGLSQAQVVLSLYGTSANVRWALEDPEPPTFVKTLPTATLRHMTLVAKGQRGFFIA